MSPSILIKSLLAEAAFFSGIPRFIFRRQILRKCFLILMYHRVIPGTEIPPWIQPGMFITDTTFERHAKFLKSNFSVLGLSDFIESIHRNEQVLDPKPVCLITFDDGWHDTYLHAYSVLKRFRLPATVFLTTRFIGTHEWFWSDRIARLARYCHEKGLPLPPDESKAFHFSSENGRRSHRDHFDSRLESVIGTMKNWTADEIEFFIEDVSTRHRFDPTPGKRAFINWEEANEMAASGLVEFGSHTHSHPILTNISPSSVRDELTQSRKELIRHGLCEAGHIPFCYPNGNFNSNVVQEVKAAGYSMAVTTRTSWNNIEADRFTLNRIGMHQDVSSTTALFAARVARLF